MHFICPSIQTSSLLLSFAALHLTQRIFPQKCNFAYYDNNKHNHAVVFTDDYGIMGALREGDVRPQCY